MRLIFFILLLVPGFLFSQIRGVTPVEGGKAVVSGETRAVIVGVSDYQNEGIPDLKFAHRDAEEFATFLQSESATVPEENIRLLLNEKATFAQMVAALDWLMEETKEGDNAIIYFSGHGDVETKTRTQLGFLLLWDSPARSYMAGGYPLFYMQAVIQTLSLDKKARVILVTDACRSGNLAGSEIGGSQLTSANLAEKFANEIKILSCQPEEYSLEGEQWGGGRGVFSFHLINGLYGKADGNADETVTLLEIGRYLEDNVTREAAPHSQLPMTVGNRMEKISGVSKEVVAQIDAEAQKMSGMIATTTTQKGDLEEDILSTVDPKDAMLYSQFKQALGEKRFFEPKDACAEFYFNELVVDGAFEKLVPTMTGNYAASLQDEAQQALNNLLDSNPDEVNRFFYQTEKYAPFPVYLQRSLELLGEDHYTAPTILAKKYFFEAIIKYIVTLNQDNLSENERRRIGLEANQLIDRALELQPFGSYLYYAKGLFWTYYQPSKIDSVIKYNEKALEISPRWLLPQLTIAHEYMYNLKDIDGMETHLKKARETNPDSYVVLERLNWLYQNNNRLDEAETICKKMLELRPDLFNSYGNLAGIYYQKKNYAEAERLYKKSLELNPGPTNFANVFLGRVYFASRRPDAGIRHYESVINHEKTPRWLKGILYSWYGKSLVNYTNNPARGIELLKKGLELIGQPQEQSENLIIQAKAKMLLNQPAEAEKLLEQARAADTTSGPTILGYALTGDLEYTKGNVEAAEKWFKKSIKHTSGVYILDMDFREEALLRYGRFLINQNRFEEAEALFDECSEYTNDTSFFGPLGRALLAAKKGKKRRSLHYMEQSLERWLPFPEMVTDEPLLEKVIKKKQFKKLLLKHFPDQHKK